MLIARKSTEQRKMSGKVSNATNGTVRILIIVSFELVYQITFSNFNKMRRKSNEQ